MIWWSVNEWLHRGEKDGWTERTDGTATHPAPAAAAGPSSVTLVLVLVLVSPKAWREDREPWESRKKEKKKRRG